MGDETPAAGGAPARFGPWRRELRAFFELLALTSIAVAQPALDLLTKNAGLFVTLRTSKLEAVALALILVLVPPVVLWVLEVVVGVAFPRARRFAHALIAAGVIAVVGVEVLKKQTDLIPRALVGLAVILGLIGGFLILRFQVVRLWLRFLAIAPVVFVILFLFSSPVTAVVFEEGTAPAKNVSVDNPKRIVMIVMDELPIESILDGTGHVDAELFPNFAALASDSTWFRNHTTVAPYTDEAVPAILTGDYPAGTYTPPVAAEYPENLFTLLGGAYRMNVHEGVTQLCPAAVCPDTGSTSTMGNGFEELLDTTYSLWREFASPKRQVQKLNAGHGQLDFDALGTGASFVRSLEPARGPQLDFLHILLPHQPWHYRVTGQEDGWLEPPPGMFLEMIWNSPGTALSARQRHLLQVQAADQLIGDVVAKLKRIGAYQESLIVVTADHGVAFTSRNSIRGITNQNYPQILWTPMFVRTPGQTEGVVDDHPVQTVDVLPTVADVIDATMPWKVDGRSMFKDGPDREPRMFHWIFNSIKPPPGQIYVTLPGAAGFATAMKGQAAAAGAPANLRLYRAGEWGGLVGQPAAPLVTSGARAASGKLDDPDRFADVDPKAKAIPWAWVQGQVNVGANAPPLAITVNGVIAGIAATSPANANRSDFWATLPPQVFRSGRNTIGVYAISGTPAGPQLAAVRLR